MTLRSISGGSGDLTAAPVAGTATGGTALAMGTYARKYAFLSAKCVLLAETNTITLEAQWQVSVDNSTWLNIKVPQNPANVAVGTGTGGADSAVTVVIDAPPGVYAFPYARIAVINRVATGAAGDTYAFTYYARQLSAGEGP